MKTTKFIMLLSVFVVLIMLSGIAFAGNHGNNNSVQAGEQGKSDEGHGNSSGQAGIGFPGPDGIVIPSPFIEGDDDDDNGLVDPPGDPEDPPVVPGGDGTGNGNGTGNLGNLEIPAEAPSTQPEASLELQPEAPQTLPQTGGSLATVAAGLLLTLSGAIVAKLNG